MGQFNSPICLSSYLMDLESLPPHSFHFDSLYAIFLLLSVCIDLSSCPELCLWLTCITAETDITLKKTFNSSKNK